MKIEVKYMSGAGNLFTVADNRPISLNSRQWSALAPFLCSKNQYNNFSTEGLLVIDYASNADFSAKFFNPDGSSEMMCGNGGRCAVMFAADEHFFGMRRGTVEFMMAGSRYRSEMTNGGVRLHLPSPVQFQPEIFIEAAGKNIRAGFVDVSSQHLVVRADLLVEISQHNFYDKNLDDLFLELRHLEKFKPGGINVNLYLPVDKNKIYLRTFERGVEAETGACGTGAISTALVSANAGETRLPTVVVPPSRKPLRIEIRGVIPNAIEEIVLEGPAEYIGSDIIEIDEKLINEE
ncbi:MAG: diaminopimelate epimerase [Candidatus Kapaibacterium sp.]